MSHARRKKHNQTRLSPTQHSSAVYPVIDSPLIVLLLLIDEQHLETPWYGTKQMVCHLRRQGYCVGRKRIRRLMRKMGLYAIYQKSNTSKAHPEHRVYPYLLRETEIVSPNQVWCADITSIPMRRGFLYLVAIMDWYNRKILPWLLSNTMDADFCVSALEEALARHGKPEIFNTDQGRQFTSDGFTGTLREAGVRISMDGKGRWMDKQCHGRAAPAFPEI